MNRRMAWIGLAVAVALVMGAGAPQKKKEPEPLPPLNEKVRDFAKDHLGRPVGDGVCVTLAVEALKGAGARWVPLDDSRGDYAWGEEVVDFKDVLPGDILQFRDTVFRGQRRAGGQILRWHQEYPHHTAIVAKVERGGKLLTIYHQNVAIEGKPEVDKGNVQEGELRMDSLQKGGWVKAYRPVVGKPRRPRNPFAEDAD